jgi:hypothetical protein
MFSKKRFLKGTGKVLENASGTGENVPERYGGKLVQLFWPF